MLQHIPPQLLADRVGIPVGFPQEPLHAAWSALSEFFCQLPPILAFDGSQ